MRKHWTGLTDDELLKTKVKHLDLDLTETFMQPLVSQLKQELKRRHILFSPQVWLGDEWCNPDGQPGVVVPFCLAHPRLIRLERKYVGFIEGTTPRSFMKMLRHETGHAIESAYKLDTHPLRELMFGNTRKPYPRSYIPNRRSRDFVRHLPDHYAQAHPDEDFAETFAVWLTPKKQWQKKYQKWPVMDKLLTMDMLMHELKHIEPVRRCTRQQFHYKQLSCTLGEYFLKRFRHYHPHLSMGKRDIERLFSKKPTYTRASHWIDRHQQELSKAAMYEHGVQKKEAHKSLSQLRVLVDQWNMYVSSNPAKKKKEVLDFVVSLSLKSKREDSNRIIM